jgi:putative transposase
MVEMGTKKRLSAGLLDAALGYLYQMILYKAVKAGKRVIFVDCKYTSQDCNICKYRNILLTLNDREWECPSCGHSHNRDFNASLNILERGIEVLKQQGWESPDAVKNSEAPSIVSNGVAEVALGNRFEI